MMRRVLVLLAVMSCGCGVAVAEDNFIRQWNSSVTPDKYEIDQYARKATIKAGSTAIFKFEAFDLDTAYPYGPGEIAIEIDWDGAGQVDVMVVADPASGRVYGAKNVLWLDLWGAASSTIRQVNISGNLASGPGGMVWANSIIGPVTVGGNQAGTISATGSITGNISIAGQLGAGISASSITGTITAAGVGTHSGNITANPGNLTAVNIGGRMNGNISVGGSLTGSIAIAGPLGGKIEIGGSVAEGRQIQVGSVLDGDTVRTGIGVGGDLGGTITVASLVGNGIERDPGVFVGGDVSGTGKITVSGDGTYGWVAVNGAHNGEIAVGGDLSGYVRLGYPSGAAHNGIVTIGGDLGGGTPQWSDPSARVYGTLNGEIRVLGALYRTASADYDIEVTSGLGTGGAIAIDWDGWDASDAWDPNATVQIGAQT